MKKMGITVKELQDTKDGGITDINIAISIIGYAMTYQDETILHKIKPSLVREALLKYVEQLEIT